MEKQGFMKALKCRECAREYPLAATHVCEFDFGPLEVCYDYDRIRRTMTRPVIESRPQTMWRYRDLLPVADEPTVGLHARDSERLLSVLRRLKNAGNTVIVVEHDPTIIAGALSAAGCSAVP